MYKVLILFIFILSTVCFPCDSVCQKKTTEALIKLKITQKAIDNISKRIKVRREYLMLSKMLLTNRIETKYFNKLELEYKDYRINFNATYDIEEDDLVGIINLVLDFE